MFYAYYNKRPSMTGNGNHTNYKNGDEIGGRFITLLYFTNIIIYMFVGFCPDPSFFWRAFATAPSAE